MKMFKRIISMAIILSLVTLGGSAEANDTKNREINKLLFTGVQLAQPGGSEVIGYADWNKKVRDQTITVKYTHSDSNVYIKTNKQGVTITGDVIFNDYYPTYAAGAKAVLLCFGY